MIVRQILLKNGEGLESLHQLDFEVDLMIMFMSPGFESKEQTLKEIKKYFPKTSIIGCSTAGEICDVNVYDDTLTITSVHFDNIDHKLVAVPVNEMKDSLDAGARLASELDDEDLKHILVLSDGLNVNGADLVSGLKSKLPNVSITGGLAGDGSDFNQTFIINNEKMSDKIIVGVGLYGKDLKVGYSSKGGWDSFGVERLVTKSENNILYELDGLPALSLYKSFLGEAAKDLPGSGLMFPLSMRVNDTSLPVVRTILAIDEENQSLTFAGNIPQGSYVRLMKANVDRLINGAEQSAKMAMNGIEQGSDLAILISCVGRRLVLKQLVEEEVEVVRDIIGPNPIITGFYSYGEIAPFGEFSPCELHNQTMTITTLSE